MVEEWYGPLQWCMSQKHGSNGSSSSSSEDDSEGEESNFHVAKEAGVFSDDEDIASHINHRNLIVPYSLEAVSTVRGSFNEEGGQIHGTYVANGGSVINVVLEPLKDVSCEQPCNVSVQGDRNETILGPVLEPNLENMGPVLHGPANDEEAGANMDHTSPPGFGPIMSVVGQHDNGSMNGRPLSQFDQIGNVVGGTPLLNGQANKNKLLSCPSELQYNFPPKSQMPIPNQGANVPTSSCLDFVVAGKAPQGCSIPRIDGLSPNPMISVRNITPSSSGGSLGNSFLETDSDILRCNKFFWKRRDKMKHPKGSNGSNAPHASSGSVAAKGTAALKVWNMAKELGVNGKENDSFYVNELQNMEDRDHQAKVMRGGPNGAQ